jgi:hypothetical protein
LLEDSFRSLSCQDPPHVLNPHNAEIILLSYEGGGISCDHMTFSAIKDPDLVRFLLMINPMYHEDPDCAISLMYKTTLQSEALTVRWLFYLPVKRRKTFEK